ncbi:5-deoxy-D-ribulose 1-phosphate aldolase [Candidatus Magnetomoraceae bacterium gMMP-15]
MLLKQEREQIVNFGKKMITSRLTTGSGGNLSIFNREKNLVAISPSGIEYFDMNPEDVVIINSKGKIIEGKYKPSSELNFHLSLYYKRFDINTIVHTHSVYATTIACLNEELPAVHYLIGFSGKKVPLAPYALFGTEELAQNIVTAIKDYNAVLLANHGLVTVGPDLSLAFSAAEEIELVARIYYQARSIGNPVILSDEEMNNVIKKFKAYINY